MANCPYHPWMSIPEGMSAVSECGPLVAAARSTLAQKVLEIVQEHAPVFRDDESERQQVIDDVDAALRELFQREGIEVKL